MGSAAKAIKKRIERDPRQEFIDEASALQKQFEALRDLAGSMLEAVRNVRRMKEAHDG